MLRRIRLANFKCFRNLTLDLGSLQVLSGLNGMGKSSLIQALLLARQSASSGSPHLKLDGGLFPFGSASDVLYEFADLDEIKLEFDFDHGRVDWTFEYDQATGTLRPHVPLKYEPNLALFNDQFRYLAAERLGPRAAYPLSDAAVRVDRNLGAMGEFTAHFLETHSGLTVAPAMRHPEGASASLMEQTRAWLGEISPGAQVLSAVQTNLNQAILQYNFPGPDRLRTRNYRPTQVGFGLSYALPVIVALLSSQPDSLTVIENPEAHLHPRGQSRLGELLARCCSTGAQCLVETHSDHLLNGVRVAVRKQLIPAEQVSIAYFESANRVEEGLRRAVSISVDSSGRLSHWPEGFFDEWDRNLEELLS